MRIGIIGAGAVGGYFGGRLVEDGADVTFIVRSKRKLQIEEHGLIIHSPHGNSQLSVPVLSEEEQAKPFDLVLLSVKAYHLSEVVNQIKRFFGSNTTILPLLNGYSHIKYLQKKFGESAILGGFCIIESTLNDKGEINHMSDHNRLVFGELNEKRSHRTEQIERLFQNVNFSGVHSNQINTDMWNKYQYISAYSGMTALMRSNLGMILSSKYGREIYLKLLNEIHSIAVRQSLSVSPETPDEIFQKVQRESKEAKSSMLRDIEKGLPIESEHLHGSLVKMSEKLELDLPVLKTIANALSLYQPTIQHISDQPIK